MKVIEFIKKNISVFNILGVIFLLSSIVIFFNSLNKIDYHGFAKGLSILILIFSLLLLILDFIFKNLIIDRIYLNLLEAALFMLSLIIFINL